MEQLSIEKLYNNIAENCLENKDVAEIAIQRYTEAMDKYPVICPYDYVSEEVHKIYNDITLSIGLKNVEIIHQLILLGLIKENFNKIYKENFPEIIKNYFFINFEEISKAIISKNYPGPFSWTNDKFLKDLSLCKLSLIPVGARKIHISKLSKKFLIAQGIKQFLEGVVHLIKIKGLSPFYQMHIDSKDPHLLKELNYEGWINTCSLIADLLKANKSIKGVFGNAWLYDPNLKNITPKFYLCKKLVTDNGGKTFYNGTDEKTIKDATIKSEKRKKLYEDGKYMPTRYLIIWDRISLIKWRDNFQRHNNKLILNG